MTPYNREHPDYPNRPLDWDGGQVLLASGDMCPAYEAGDNWEQFTSETGAYEPGSIVGYTPRNVYHYGHNVEHMSKADLLTVMKDVVDDIARAVYIMNDHSAVSDDFAGRLRATAQRVRGDYYCLREEFAVKKGAA